MCTGENLVDVLVCVPAGVHFRFLVSLVVWFAAVQGVSLLFDDVSFQFSL